MKRKVLIILLLFVSLTLVCNKVFAREPSTKVNIFYDDNLIIGNLNYKDDWFLSDSYVYNNDLAIISSLLVNASSGSYLINSKNTDIERVARNLGFDSTITFNYGKEDNDDLAFGLSHKTIKDESKNDIDLIAISLRGSGYGDYGFGNNFKLGINNKYHEGFYLAAKSTFDIIFDHLNSLNVDLKNVRIWITGFSRSAAAANILSILLSENTEIQRKNIYTYAFATPNYEQNIISNDIYNNIFNIINPNDLVPVFPLKSPEGWNFSRRGIDIILNEPIDIAKYNDLSSKLEHQVISFVSDVSYTELVKIIFEPITSQFDTREAYVEMLQPLILSVYQKDENGEADLSLFDTIFGCEGTIEGFSMREFLNNLYVDEQINIGLIIEVISKTIDYWEKTYGDDHVYTRLLKKSLLAVYYLFVKIITGKSELDNQIIPTILDIINKGESAPIFYQHYPSLYISRLLTQLDYIDYTDAKASLKYVKLTNNTNYYIDEIEKNIVMSDENNVLAIIKDNGRLVLNSQREINNVSIYISSDKKFTIEFDEIDVSNTNDLPFIYIEKTSPELIFSGGNRIIGGNSNSVLIENKGETSLQIKSDNIVTIRAYNTCILGDVTFNYGTYDITGGMVYSKTNSDGYAIDGNVTVIGGSIHTAYNNLDVPSINGNVINSNEELLKLYKISTDEAIDYFCDCSVYDHILNFNYNTSNMLLININNKNSLYMYLPKDKNVDIKTKSKDILTNVNNEYIDILISGFGMVIDKELKILNELIGEIYK